ARVHLGKRRRAVALGLYACADDDEALALVVLGVRPALGEARVADDAHDLVALDQLARERGLLRRVELLVVERVLDRTAVDAAVVVDAVEVRLGRLADRHEVDAGDEHVDAAELDRRTRRLLAGALATDGLGRGRRAGADQWGGCRARGPGGRQERQDAAGRERKTDSDLRRSHSVSLDSLASSGLNHV